MNQPSPDSFFPAIGDNQVASIDARPGHAVSCDAVAGVLIITLWLEGAYAEEVLANSREDWWCSLHLGEVCWARLRPAGVFLNRLAMRVVSVTPASDLSSAPFGRFVAGTVAIPSADALAVIQAAAAGAASRSGVPSTTTEDSHAPAQL